MTTPKGEARRARKAEVAAGRPWTVGVGEHGGLQQVTTRTRQEERRHRFDCFHQRNCGALFDATPEPEPTPTPIPDPPRPLPPPDEPEPVLDAPKPVPTPKKERVPMAVEGNGLASVIAEAIWPSIEERLAAREKRDRWPTRFRCFWWEISLIERGRVNEND